MTEHVAQGHMNRPHWSLWVVGVLALIWNGMGCLNFFMQQSTDMLAQMPESHRAIAESRPMWANIAFAVAVFSGALGALLLLLRKSLARLLFLISLAATIIAMLQAIAMGGALDVFGPAEIALGVIGPIVVALFLVWFGNKARASGWTS